MLSTNNPLSSISYTNKDFESIYPELLDTVKKLSYKWDPTISNESDPGVLLLKLNALIADKVNYNADVNVLECFPISVTQERNARKLYEQLGYYMHWYQSANTQVSMVWSGESSSNFITIPPFTMVSDEDKKVIYSLIGSNDTKNVSEVNVFCDGRISNFYALQGVAVNYDINGQKLIKTSDLDENRRLYFTTNAIAENGIFIKNANSNDWNSWQRVDNLLVENSGNNYFQFGVSQEDEIAYIEFPEDADVLFGNGINITYLITDGYDGNVNLGIINTLYNDLSLTFNSGDAVVLNADNISLLNVTAGIGGRNPETIEDAYRNYQRTVGTFDTLVTLRDYYNAIVSLQVGSSGVANGFVCDRTNDIQNTFKVMTLDNNVNFLETAVERPPVQIKQYSNGTLGTYFTFTNTETFASQYLNGSRNNQYVVIQYANEQYNIAAKGDIDPNVTLSDAGLQATEEQPTDPTIYVLAFEYPDNEVLSAFDLKLYFTQYVDIINNNSDYNTTFTLKTDLDTVTSYIDDEKCINHDFKALDELGEDAHICMIKNKYPVILSVIPSYQLTDAQKDEVKEVIITALRNNLNAKVIDFGQKITSEDVKSIVESCDSRIKSVNINELNFKTYAVYRKNDTTYEVLISEIVPEVSMDISETKTTSADGFVTVVMSKPSAYKSYLSNLPANVNGYYRLQLVSNSWALHELDGNVWNLVTTVANTKAGLAQLGIALVKVGDKNFAVGSKIYLHASDLYEDSKQIREEIYAKSVLAGKTPFLVASDSFNHNLDQIVSADHLIEGISAVETVNRIPSSSQAVVGEAYTLKDNEVIQFYGPSLSDVDSYSNYVKYQCKITNSIPADSDYELRPDEYLVFYWKNNSSEDLYSYMAYGQGNIIHPSFAISVRDDSAPAAVRNNFSSENKYRQSSNEYPLSDENNTVISNIHDNTYILSGSKEIKTRATNIITIGTGVYCGWITNTQINDKYLLFSTGDDEYTLEANEYFIYADSKLTNFATLGPGTTLKLSAQTTYNWYCDKLDVSAFTNNPSSIDNTYWKQLYEPVTIIENQVLTLIGGNLAKYTTDVFYDSVDYISSLQDETVSGDVEYSTDSGTTWTALPTINLADYSWKIRTRLNLNCSPDSPQILLTDQIICLLNPGETTADCEKLVIDDSDPDSPEENTLYVITSANDSVAVLKKGEDLLEIGQAIIGGDVIDWSTLGDDHISYPCAVQFSENLTSGIVSRVDDLNVDLYFYEKVEPTSSANYLFTDDGQIRISFPIGVNSVSIPVSPAAGNYLITLLNGSRDLSSITVTYGDDSSSTTLVEYGTGVSNFAQEGSYSLGLTAAAEASKNLTIDIQSQETRTSEIILVITNVFKYKVDETNQDIIDMEAVEDKILKLLTYTDHKFDFSYQVSENTKIANPLDANSFFNINHILNQFTICQMDTDKVNFLVLGDN